MQKIVLFIDPAQSPWTTPSKIGNLLMNRFTIDEDANSETLKTCHLEHTFGDFYFERLTREEGLDHRKASVYQVYSILMLKIDFLRDPSKQRNSTILLILE